MLYVNPAVFRGVLVAPSEIVRKNLKKASAIQLKVLLAVCLHPDRTAESGEIAAEIGEAAAEVEDCLIYWQDNGLLCEAGTVPAAPDQSPAVKKEEEKPPVAVERPVLPAPDLRPEKLSREQIAARLTESAELRVLMNDAQLMLGRTIGQNDQSSLINLHDFYGLPPALILMICEYARLTGKAGNMSHIVRTGASWSRRGIDTYEAAEAELERLEQTNETWEAFLRITDGAFPQKPTDKQRSTVDKWVNDWHMSDAVTRLAFEEMRNSLGDRANIGYMDRILAAWYSAGATDPEKVVKLKEKHEADKAASSGAKPRGKRTTESNEGASYDIDRAVDRANNSVPTVKKKQKR